MSFDEALKELNIEDYKERIYKSNSHGELFHLIDYIFIVEFFKKENIKLDWFRNWFEQVIEMAAKTWDRPESVFQHIRSILTDSLKRN